MFVSALMLFGFGFLPFVLAEGNLAGLLQALNSSCLDQFANLTASLNGTANGRQVLAQLLKGNNTIFAPSDSALSCINPSIINNETSLADLIAYHIVPGNFVNQTQTYPNVTVGRTLLNASSLVMLEGNQSQVLVWSKYDNGTFFVMNQGCNVTVVNSTNYNNTAILTVESALTPPPNISTVLNDSTYNLTLLTSFLNSTTLPNGSSLLDVLGSARGITLFAPNNAAIQAAQSSLSGLSNSTAARLAVLSNHVINGTSVYSTEFPGSNYTSAAGQNLAFTDNSTGSYVSVGGGNPVQIVDANVLASNGVIHIIDGVMLDTRTNVTAASSAFASATSAAAHATETGPITGASTPETTTTTPTPATTTSSSAAGNLKGVVNKWIMGLIVWTVVNFGQFA